MGTIGCDVIDVKIKSKLVMIINQNGSDFRG